MKEDTRPIMVSIHCLAFNHEPYIRQCLEGFVMQKTDFRFEAIVHDDASTDGTTAIVMEYADKYPNIIKPIIESENQYTKSGGSFDYLHQIMSDNSHGKYVALCEGDDYWLDPLKLQKQVDYMEKNDNCTMVCNRTKRFSVRKNCFLRKNVAPYNKNQNCNVKDVIMRGGLFIATCSILYRKEIRDDYPDYCKKCHVGDFPLQIMAAMKGEVYYMNDCMSVYRVESNQSWVGRHNEVSYKRMISGCLSEIQMIKGFSNDYPQYKDRFTEYISRFINLNMPSKWCNRDNHDLFCRTFRQELKNQSLYYRCERFFYENSISVIPRVINRIHNIM